MSVFMIASSGFILLATRVLYSLMLPLSIKIPPIMRKNGLKALYQAGPKLMEIEYLSVLGLII